MELDERTRQLFQDCLDIIQRIHKGKPIGIPVDKIVPGVYVVDWRAEKADDLDTIRVERVVAVKDGMVEYIQPSFTDVETFASIVLAGPFED